MSISKILCPIDFSDVSLEGMRFAKGTAKKFNALLVLMHVTHDLFHGEKSDPYYTESLTSFVDEYSRLTRLKNELTDVKATVHHCLGNPAKEIVNYAQQEKCDLIVLGSHGRSGIQKMVLGSVAENVAQNAQTNTLIVKKTEAFHEDQAVTNDQQQTVVVPFDFTDASVKALSAAADFAGDPKRVYAVHVCPSDCEAEREEIEASFRTKFYESYCPAELKTAQFQTCFHSQIAQQIRQFAEEKQARLIVLPHNQKSFLQRFFLGSVALDILKKSPCPTLILKSDHPLENLAASASDTPKSVAP